MINFAFKKVASAQEAAKLSGDHVRFLAGGTNLIDLMKLEVENPRTVVDINHLPLADVKAGKNGLEVGALVRNTDLAYHELVVKNFPVLSQAILSGASAQLRNQATTGGNLLQRTRCVYFRDPSKPCNKREPGSGCSAMEGFNRNLAILGTSESCIASNPSDMNVAMRALEARVQIMSGAGSRDVAIGEFYLLPGKTPHIETVLKPGEIITGVTIPNLPTGTKSLYLKLRDRASYEFALASAAVIATVSGGKMSRMRMAMGGVGAIPWRSESAEKILEGKAPSEAVYKQAADEFLKDAKPKSQNAFKVELAKRCLVHALKQAVPV